MFSRLYSLISPTVTIEELNWIWVTTRYIYDIASTFLGCLGFDILDLLEFTAWTRDFGHYKKHLVLFIKGFQIHFPTPFQFSINAWHHWPCCPGPLPRHPWRFPGWTFCFRIYEISTCDQTFFPSCTVRSNSRHRDDSGCSFHADCSPLVHQSLFSSYNEPLRMYCCNI